MKLWLIGGSSSQVGKSKLASEITDVLDKPVNLKLGHGKTKKSKSNNYFTNTNEALEFIDSSRAKFKHCVAEATRLIGNIDADVVIFLNQHNEIRRSDADELAYMADIVLGDNANPDGWMAALAPLDIPVSSRRKLIRIFQNQHEFLTGSQLSIRTKIWINRDGKTVFGEGIARLLSAIDNQGSLAKAAKKEGISYRHAWGDIKRAEERLEFKLIERQTGGAHGGGSKLTEKARKLIDGYWRIKRRAIRESDKSFEKLAKSLESDS
ncbi:LysR family transcriptional regulator [bacterium]|nr:LysR family transcriptional regulator [bacterium]